MRGRRSRRAVGAAVAGAAMIATMTSAVRAVDHSWIGPSGGSWSVAANWSPAVVPPGGVFNERTFLDSTTPKTIFFDYDYPTSVPNSVEMQSQLNAAKVTLQLNPNPGTRKFNVNNIGVGGQGNAELIDSAQPLITNTLYVGFNSTSTGTLTLSGTAPVTSGYTSVGQVGFGTIIQSGNSSITQTGNYDLGNFGNAYHQMTGGTLSFATSITNVAWHGTATLDVQGGVASGHQIWIGSGTIDGPSPAGSGSLLVSGTGRAVVDSLWVGLQPEPPPDPELPPPTGDIVGGNGVVRVFGAGASLQAGFINSRGTISIENQGSLTAGTINVGHLGVGTMTVVGGGSATIGTLVVGLDAPPAAPISPAPSQFQFNGGVVNVAGDTIVGAGTPGRVAQGGGIFTPNRMVFGSTSGVTGEDSMGGGTLNTNAGLIVADHGTATFTVDTLPSVVPTTVRVGGALLIGNGAGSLGVGNGTFALVSGSLTVNTSNAPGTAEVIGAAGNGTVVQNAGAHRINGDVVMGRDAGSRGFYRISGGSLSVGGVMNVGMSGTGTLQLDGGRVEIPSVIRVRPTGKVNFNGGQLDLSPASAGSLASGGGMIVDYTGGTTPIASLRAQIVSGYANGAWTGAGIISSLAVATPGRAIGYAEATDLFSNFPATFMGQTGISNRTVLLRATFAGDSNLDAKVDLTDFTFMAANFNGTNKSWLQGDYNYDGKVDLTDFTFLASNFNKSLPAAAITSVGTAVPEPTATAAYLATAAIALTHTRRRRRSLC